MCLLYQRETAIRKHCNQFMKIYSYLRRIYWDDNVANKNFIARHLNMHSGTGKRQKLGSILHEYCPRRDRF